MSDPTHMADQLLEIVAELRRRPQAAAADAWITAFSSGEILTVDQAAYIANCSGETIRRRCEQTCATDRPLGVRLASVWIVSRFRLLGMIEQERSRHDRLVAESRSREIAKLWSAPQETPLNVERATG